MIFVLHVQIFGFRLKFRTFGVEKLGYFHINLGEISAIVKMAPKKQRIERGEASNHLEGLIQIYS